MQPNKSSKRKLITINDEDTKSTQSDLHSQNKKGSSLCCPCWVCEIVFALATFVFLK